MRRDVLVVFGLSHPFAVSRVRWQLSGDPGKGGVGPTEEVGGPSAGDGDVAGPPRPSSLPLREGVQQVRGEEGARAARIRPDSRIQGRGRPPQGETPRTRRPKAGGEGEAHRTGPERPEVRG